MSKMIDMMDSWLGLPTNETIRDDIRDTTMLKSFKKALTRETGYKGIGMCMRCSARLLINNENWCAHYARKCNGIAGSCTGTR